MAEQVVITYLFVERFFTNSSDVLFCEIEPVLFTEQYNTDIPFRFLVSIHLSAVSWYDEVCNINNTVSVSSGLC